MARVKAELETEKAKLDSMWRENHNLTSQVLELQASDADSTRTIESQADLIDMLRKQLDETRQERDETVEQLETAQRKLEDAQKSPLATAVEKAVIGQQGSRDITIRVPGASGPTTFALDFSVNVRVLPE